MRFIIGVIMFMCICGVFSRSTRLSRSNNNNNEKCNSVRPFFESLNITVNENKENELSKIGTCGGQCCNRKTEEHLREYSRSNFHSLIHHHSRVLQGHLAKTAETLRETVTALARQSENKTLILFEQVYRSMSMLTRPSIKTLYQTMIDYVEPITTTKTTTTTLFDNIQQSSRTILQENVNKFFIKLFPTAYHHVVNPNKQDFTDKFKDCLYESIDMIKPFGDIPKHISHSVSKSLEAMRVLIQALNFGELVLDKIDSSLFHSTSFHQSTCNNGLLKMTYCPKCSGYTSVTACKGLCKNIVRGCLVEPASELDLAWSGYVETVERLVVAIVGKTDYGLNAERAIRELDTQISEAVMQAMKNGPALEEKVRKACGRIEIKEEISSEFDIDSKDSSVLSNIDRTPVVYTSSQLHRSSPEHLQTQLGNFVANIVGSRTFYGTLADSICAEYPETECWNGERVGEYTKAVVDSSLNAQKYNPEFNGINTTISSHINSNTSKLIDQLRHINQVIQSQLAYAPDVNALMSDEPDDDGSGSSPGIDDYPGSGSGSGDGPVSTDPPKIPEPETPKPPPSSANMMTKSIALFSLIWLIYYSN